MNLSLYFLYPIFLFFLYQKNKNRSDVCTTIYALYLFVSIVAVLMLPYFVSNIPQNVNPSFLAIGYHCLMLLLLLKPFTGFEHYSNQILDNREGLILSIFTIVTILFSVISLYDSISKVDIDSILHDVQGLRNKLGEMDDSVTLIEHISFFARIYKTAALSLFFYYLIYHPEKKLLIIILFACSLLSVVSGLQYAAREYVIKYCFTFVMLFILLQNQLSLEVKKTVKRTIIVIAIISISFFFLISQLRFTGETTNLLGGTVGYLSQGIVFFPSYFSEFQDGIGGGGMYVPILFHSKISVNNLGSQVVSNLQLNTFSTSIGSWMQDGGLIMATIMTILYSIFIKQVLKQRMTIFTLIYVIWIFEFIFSNLFFYNNSFSLSRVLSYISIFFFDILYNRQEN